MEKNIKFPTAGVIVIKNDMTILVETHKEYFSFPKGGRHKNETHFECAIRELFEETGLDHKKLKFIENLSIDEFSNKNYPSVKYFIGILNENFDDFKFDENELKNARWYKIDDALKLDKLKDTRKSILIKAYETSKNNNLIHSIHKPHLVSS
jgi:8-oxo-dGTP pyrophosphatase MutT (NUDIX family)